MKMKYVITGFAAVAMLGACSNKESIPTAVDVQTWEYKTNQVTNNVETIPEWFLKHPEETDTVFSTGTSVMPDLQSAVDIAKLNAKEQLADRVYSKLRSQTKTYSAKIGQDDSDASMLMEVEKATKNLVADAEVNGYEQREVIVVPHGTQYRAFVLLAYNHLEAQKVIKNRLLTERAKLSHVKSQIAYKELDEEVEKVKDEDNIIDNFTGNMDSSE